MTIKKAKGLSLILVLTIVLWGIFIFPCSPQSTDKLTIVTYYPSPYGVYNQLVTRALGVGDNDGDGSITSADAPDPTAKPGELWVAGNVGIGTTTPGTNKLYVAGNTKIDGDLNVTGKIISGGSSKMIITRHSGKTGRTDGYETKTIDCSVKIPPGYVVIYAQKAQDITEGLYSGSPTSYKCQYPSAGRTCYQTNINDVGPITISNVLTFGCSSHCKSSTVFGACGTFAIAMKVN